MSVESELIHEDAVSRTIRETFIEDGQVACVSERVELKNPAPAPPDLDALKAKLAKATSTAGLKAVLADVLDALDQP